jgi:three-Cys-motif partner protein
MIPLDHVGHEQTSEKYSLFKAYLQRLFMVIGKRETTINYVACLTAPWQQRGEDVTDTSVAVSLDTMQECHHELNAMRKYVQFRGLFVETGKKPFAKLEKFVKSKSWAGTKAHCINGDFHELRREILSWCGKGDFSFFFIDPTEWKQASLPTLSLFLKRPQSEFLINFNYEFFLRAHPEESLDEQVKTILGTAPDTSVMEPKEKEEFLLNLYCRKLKSAQGTGR